MQLWEASFQKRFLRLFAVCFSATGSFHVASRAFGGWLFCPQGPADAHGLPCVPPKKLNICSLDFWEGVWAKRCSWCSIFGKFSATRSVHVASRAFCGWLFCPQCPADAHDARPYSCLRYPQQPNIRSLDFGKGVLGKTVFMMLLGGAAWGTVCPIAELGLWPAAAT